MAPKANPDLAFMNNRLEWPNWPFLPIKRFNKGSPVLPREFAVVFASDPLRVKVGANLFNLRGEHPSKWEATTAEKLIADGWKVD